MNKTIKKSIVIGSVIAAVLFIYLIFDILFSKINDDWQSLFFIFGTILFILLLYFALRIPLLFIRNLMMKKLAREFNLNFNSRRYLSRFSDEAYWKMNLLSGILGGQNVEIYDNFFIYGDHSDRTTAYYTTFIKDRQCYGLEGLIWGFPSINTLRKWLRLTKEGKDYRPRNSYALKLLVRLLSAAVMLIFLFLLIIFIPIFLSYFFKI